jgi:hypothetical protein
MIVCVTGAASLPPSLLPGVRDDDRREPAGGPPNEENPGVADDQHRGKAGDDHGEPQVESSRVVEDAAHEVSIPSRAGQAQGVNPTSQVTRSRSRPGSLPVRARPGR